MKLPGPFHITRVAETAEYRRDLNFVLPDATPETFAATRTARDARFVDIAGQKLIMSCHSLIVRTARHIILVDTCVGNDKERPGMAQWHKQHTPFIDSLKAAGVNCEDVTHVLCTHLHADHIGWNTKLLNGRWAPTFPNAKYILHRQEVEHAERQRHVAASPIVGLSWDDSIQPILDARQAVLVDSDYEIEAGVRLMPAPGHTPGNVVLALDDGQARAYLVGDTMHHPVQIERPQWSSRFCWDAAMSRDSRFAFLARVADTEAWVIPAHFAPPCAVRVSADQNGFTYSTEAP